MIQVHAAGHWAGDPGEHCGELTVTADSLAESKALAVLYRVLRDPSLREHLFEVAGEVERHGRLFVRPVFESYPATC